MRYGVTVNDSRGLDGSREEVRSILVGILLAAGADRDTVRKQADALLHLADGLPSDETQGMKLASIGELRVWRERGREVPGRIYFVKSGDLGPAFRTTSNALLTTYITGLMVGDGVGLERAAALGELATNCLSEGGYYPSQVLTELKDGTDVLAWWEDEA